MKDQLFSVTGKVVLVSGGSRGIGKELALAFAKKGAKVIISGREISTLKKVINDNSCVSNIIPKTCDVSVESEINSLVNFVIKNYDRVDVLLNVAGISKRKKIEDFSAKEFDQILDINLKGGFLLSQKIGKHMIKRKAGSIINIDSLNTYSPLRGVGPYAISKSGVLMMTRSMALEWGRHEIRVNSIAPGFFPTKMTKATWEKKHMMEWYENNTPLKKLGNVSDLIGTAIFLASDASQFITGQTIRVDGGISAGINWPLNL